MPGRFDFSAVVDDTGLGMAGSLSGSDYSGPIEAAFVASKVR